MSLTEVLISFFIFITAMLGISQQKIKLLFTMQNNYFHSLALSQALSLRERLRADDNLNFQAIEVSNWRQENVALFPDASSSMQYQNNCYAMKLCWKIKELQCLRITLPA